MTSTSNQNMTPSPPHPAAIWSGFEINLPLEVYHYIGYNLTYTGLASCSRVSKEWNMIFSPLLYMAINLRESRRILDPSQGNLLSTAFAERISLSCHERLGVPSVAAFRRYGHFIQHLAIDKAFFFKKSILCKITSLKDLRVYGDMNGFFYNSLPRNTFGALFENNPQIRILDFYRLDLSNEILWILQRFKHLKKLRLCKSVLNLLNLQRGIGTSLTHLSMTDCNIKASPHRPAQDELKSLGITELQFVKCCGPGWSDIYELLPCCPELTAVVFGSFGDSKLNKGKLRFYHCNSLVKFTVLNLKDDKETTYILKSLPKTLEDLHLMSCDIGEQTLESARNHFGDMLTLTLTVRTKTSSDASWKKAKKEGVC